MARTSGARSVSIGTFAVVKQVKSASVFVLFCASKASKTKTPTGGDADEQRDPRNKTIKISK